MGRGRYTSKSRGCFPTHLLNMHFVCDEFSRFVRLFGDGWPGFWWRVGSWWPPVKLQYFTNDNLLLIVVAVTWLKILPIRRITLYNQSINLWTYRNQIECLDQYGFDRGHHTDIHIVKLGYCNCRTFDIGHRKSYVNFLGHLSHSVDLLLWVGVRPSPQKLLGQS